MRAFLLLAPLAALVGCASTGSIGVAYTPADVAEYAAAALGADSLALTAALDRAALRQARIDLRRESPFGRRSLRRLQSAETYAVGDDTVLDVFVFGSDRDARQGLRDLDVLLGYTPLTNLWLLGEGRTVEGDAAPPVALNAVRQAYFVHGPLVVRVESRQPDADLRLDEGLGRPRDVQGDVAGVCGDSPYGRTYFDSDLDRFLYAQCR